MWKTLRPFVVVASAALNVAFVAIWLVHAAVPGGLTPKPAEREGVWCPLHRQLDVTDEQWTVIEPRLIAFQESVGRLREQVDVMRAEVIDLLAAETPDLDAIHARQEDILAVRRAIQAKMVEHLMAERETLTPAQQVRFFEILRERSACGAAGPPMSGGGWLNGKRRTSNTENGA